MECPLNRTDVSVSECDEVVVLSPVAQSENVNQVLIVNNSDLTDQVVDGDPVSLLSYPFSRPFCSFVHTLFVSVVFTACDM